MRLKNLWAASAALILVLAGCGDTSANTSASATSQIWGAQKSCTTNSSGVCSITHNLGVVPEGITATLVNRSGLIRIQSKSVTTVTLLVAKSVTSNGSVTPWASTSITVELVASYVPGGMASPSAVPSITPSTVMPTTPSASPSTPPVTNTPSTGARECPAFPAFPDGNCTGVPAGTTLKNCNTVVEADNAKLDSCLFDGGLLVRGKNVTVTNSKIKGLVAADYVLNWNLSGLKLQDVEIDGTGHVTANGEAAIGYDNYTCIRCNVHHSGRGFNFQNNVTIKDSWAHDFTYVDGAHQSAAGSNGGSGNVVTHNRFNCSSQGCSGALVMYGDFHPVDNVEIKNNLFDGGAYCLYAGSTGESSGKPYPHGTNIKIIDNMFGKSVEPRCGFYGPVAAWEANTGNVWSSNTWQDGSGSVNP